MELTSDQALQKGIEAHKAGLLQEADKLYTDILKNLPKHPDANHNMGVLAVGIGKLHEALPFFKTALEATPSVAQFWLSYIDALINLGRIDEARDVFDQSKEKGAKGEGFDELEKRLPEPVINGRNPQEPPSNQSQPIINLYRQGQSQQALTEAGQMLERFPNSVILHHICGASNSALMQFDAAIESYKQALTIKPDFADAYNNMGVALQYRGDLDAAIDSFKQALKIKPHYADAYINMGNVLSATGDQEAAIDSFKEALKIKPDYAEAHCNMGNALKDNGDQEAAIDSFKEALKIKPEYAEAYINLGIILSSTGDQEAAIDSFKEALKIKPEYAEAYNNMGNALKDKGDLKGAIESYKQALKIKSDYAEAYNNMGITLQDVIFSKPNPDMQSLIVSILDGKTYVRPSVISHAAISLLKFEPSIKKILNKQSVNELRCSLQEIILDLSKVPLLLKLMSICPLADLELENVLMDIRFSLLSSVSEDSLGALDFQSALALQCFTNEYVYNHSDKETKALEVLENIAKEALLKGKQPSPQSILCLASYKALHEYEWCDLIAVNPSIQDVFARQVLEPKQESHLKADIPALQEITDKVSSKVRTQYEANPYPRWVNLGLDSKPKTISKVVNQLKLKLVDQKINKVKNPNILIAGCGTGQHSIETSQRFENCSVLAVDLSLSSLAYAKRKTDELRLKNIEYMQADILDLGKLERQFDIVESAGVLHHMKDPMAGWRVLTDCLKTGGLMNIGLYSELARTDIVEMREEISQSGIGLSDRAMRSFRNDLVQSTDAHHKRILSSSDFYSLSNFRDLLFHVQEHRFTISQIKDCLAELGLEFCGFELKNIVQNFKLTNTDPDDPYDLAKWSAYEQLNPITFVGMYQFWCQKVT